MSATAAAEATGAPDQVRAGLLSDRFLTFRLDARRFALPLERVKEITPYTELNRMPHMPRSVEGILDLRGTVLPVINLRNRLGLPAADIPEGAIVLVLDLETAPSALLVDQVDGVMAASGAGVVPSSPLLAGLEGAWVTGFLVSGPQVVPLLDPGLVATPGIVRGHGREVLANRSLEERLDEGLRQMLEAAPEKEDERTRIVPQLESAISYSEMEMTKVLVRVEQMLGGTDGIFQGLVMLKQECGLGHLKGQEHAVVSLEKLNQELQDEIFALMQQLQFQDIARQKLERVLSHLQGLQHIISSRFRDLGDMRRGKQG